MSISPIIIVACGLIGCVSGATSGAQHSLGLASLGAGVGLVLGISSNFALTIPYVGWLIHFEKRSHVPITEPPRFWKYLFLPVMAASIILAAVIPWLILSALFRYTH